MTEPVHYCDWCDQNAARIVCDQSWDRPVADTDRAGVYRRSDDSLYTFEVHHITCRACLAHEAERREADICTRAHRIEMKRLAKEQMAVAMWDAYVDVARRALELQDSRNILLPLRPIHQELMAMNALLRFISRLRWRPPLWRCCDTH